MPIDPAKVIAIDVHVHAEVSCHDPEDPVMAKFFDAASTYFKADRKRPTIPETIAYYRERNIAFCLFTVDAECGMGTKRISNYEVADIAAEHSDIVIPFASIDPHKGKLGAREARGPGRKPRRQRLQIPRHRPKRASGRPDGLSDL